MKRCLCCEKQGCWRSNPSHFSCSSGGDENEKGGKLRSALTFSDCFGSECLLCAKMRSKEPEHSQTMV